MQVSETSLKLIKTELERAYFMWETACDESWDREHPTLSKRKEFELNHLKQKFNEWVQLVHELGFIVVWDDFATSECGQAVFNIVTKECLDTLKKLNFKENEVQVI